MSKFDRKLTKAKAQMVAVPFEMTEIAYPNEPIPVLMVYPAGEVNKDLFAAIQKRNANKRRGRISDTQIQERARANARDFYPLYVVQDWKDVRDNDGNQVPFTPTDCKDFLEHLPNHALDALIVYTGNMLNFNNLDPVDPEAAAETGKN